MLTLRKLRRLLSGELDDTAEKNGADSRALEFPHTVPTPLEALEEMQMVEPLMKRLSQRAPAATPATHDKHPTGTGRGPQLGRQLGEEVVRLMLDNLAQDQRLLPAIDRRAGTQQGDCHQPGPRRQVRPAPTPGHQRGAGRAGGQHRGGRAAKGLPDRSGKA